MTVMENAIRHGIAPYAAPGQVTVRSRRDNGFLRLEVRDSGPGVAGKSTVARSGIGLANIRSRLDQLYGSRHTFEILSGSREGFTVNITLPFQTVQPTVLS